MATAVGPSQVDASQENPDRDDQVEDTKKGHRLDLAAPDRDQGERQANERSPERQSGPQRHRAIHSIAGSQAAMLGDAGVEKEEGREHGTPDQERFSPNRQVPVPEEQPRSNHPGGRQQDPVTGSDARSRHRSSSPSRGVVAGVHAGFER